jgi:hypothetical protein
MRKKVSALAMFLMFALLVGYLFADDDDDNGNYYRLSFQGTGQDACSLTNVDDLEDPTEEFCDDECDNGCGESFIFYDLNLTVVYNRVFGKLEWYGCWTQDREPFEFKCSDPIQSRLKGGRLLRDKKFDNTYLSFAVTSERINTEIPNCSADNNRDYFMLLAIKDDSGNIIRLEGGATAFSEEDCAGWEAAEITRVVLHSN